MMEEFRNTMPELGLDEDYFGDTEFMLYTYKVERCMISQPHAWKNCPFVHHQEPIKRRHPTQHMPHLCPLVKKGQTCPDEKCCWAHNAFELWLHPERYKTIMCRKGAACGRGICFFAHSEAELRVPSKAKPVDLSQNPVAAAAAVEAALKFKAVAQAIPAAAISAAPVSGRRSPVALQIPPQAPQMSLGVPAMSLGVPSATSAMSLGVPMVPSASLPMAMSLGVPDMSQVVAEGRFQLSPLDAGLPEYNTPVSLSQGLLMVGNSSHMGWTGNGVRYAVDASVGSSNCSSCTGLDADVMMSDLYTGPSPADGSSSGNMMCSSGMPTIIAAPNAPVSFQQFGYPFLQTSAPVVSFTGFNGSPMPQQQYQQQQQYHQQPQQPALIDLSAAAAAVRAEMERASTAANSAEALQAAADRVASMLLNGPFGGLCMGATVGQQQQQQQQHAVDTSRKSRSLDLPTVGINAVTEQLQQQQLMRVGSY